jgi:phage-related minor tail protein
MKKLKEVMKIIAETAVIIGAMVSVFAIYAAEVGHPIF